MDWNWNTPTLWWIATALLVAAELTSGTFYLLMMALGATAAALVAHAGASLTGQLLAAALVGGGAVALWHARRGRMLATADNADNRDINLDIGSRVRVSHWHANGSARVHYRGAGWDARFVGGSAPSPGEYVIRGIEGNCLLLDRLDSSAE